MNARFYLKMALASLLAVTALLATLVAPATAKAADTGWRGEYYGNRWLAGTPVLVRHDPEINFDWGRDAPDPLIPADNFSVRWTRTVHLEGGRYRFTTETDDGVRLFLNGQLVIGRWHDQARTTYSVERDLPRGEHNLRMEYYESGGVAVARLWWARVDAPIPPTALWRGEYFANRWLTGAPVLVRDDPDINFDWGWGSPDPSIPADNFSARWTRNVHFESGRYRFTVEADDGVRLYVGSNLIIDRWSDSARRTDSAEVKLSTGVHAVRLEYYEHTGTAVVRLKWERLVVPRVGNIITCVRPSNSWIKVYRLDGDHWVDVNPRGWGPIDVSGYLKLDGFQVDFGRYGYAGQPYRVELWANGSLIRAVGDTARGQPEFRVRPAADNHTPWGCPAP